MESIFYFKHSILNTPCPPFPGARLRDLKTIFYNWFFKFVSHQAFSHSRGGHDAGSATAPALGVSQPEGLGGTPQEPSPTCRGGGVSSKFWGWEGTAPHPTWARLRGACPSTTGLGTPRGTARVRAAPSLPPATSGGRGSPSRSHR